MSSAFALLVAYLGAHPLIGLGLVGIPAVLLVWLWWALRDHPVGFWFIFWGELAERASFYGMRTVLALYLINVLHFEQSSGASIMQFFMAACYLTPLLGGFLADRFLGRYRTILYFSGPYILGHIILGGWENRTALFVALALLALGSGSIKPNASTLMGAMYEKAGKEALLTRAFSYYYAAINVGSFISTFTLPLLRNTIHDADVANGATDAAGWSHGYSVALMIPAVLMAAAFLLFAVGKKHYAEDVVEKQPVKTPEQTTAERATLGRIIGLFLLIAVFWFVYDQSASTWIYFAQDHMDLVVFKNFPGLGTLTTTPDQIQSLNPFLIILLTPVFNLIWDLLKHRRGGVDVPDTRKMLIGFFIVVACMATMSVAGFLAGDGKVTVWWMIIATFVITLSELCVSVVGLEFAFKVASPGTKSFVTGVFWLMVFLGDFFGGFFNQLWGKMSAGMFFSIQTAIMMVALVAAIPIARKFERTTEPTGSPRLNAA